MNAENRSDLWLAADGMDPSKLRNLLQRVSAMQLGGVKINDGLDDPGPELLQVIADSCGAVPFADVKLADIPETNRRRARKLALRGARIITVKADCGVEGIKKAVEGVTKEDGSLLANIYVVGVLTSMKDDDVRQMYNYPTKAMDNNPESATVRQQRKFFRMAADAGAHGLICAVGDIAIAKEIGWGGRIATPAIRSPGANPNDQERLGSPAGAKEAGSNAIIMGREIVDAEDPVEAILNVYRQIGYTI